MSTYRFVQRFPVVTVALGTLALAVSAADATVTYDASLVSPDNANAPGLYVGSGNPNGAFTVEAENGIERGLRAKLPSSSTVTDSPMDVYFVPIGDQAASPNHDIGNYGFSIDLAPQGMSSGYTLGDIASATTLTITDITTGATSTLKYWGDDSEFGSTQSTPETPTKSRAQNSENLVAARLAG